MFFAPWVFNHFNILCGNFNFNIANFGYILTFRDKPSNFNSLLLKLCSKLIWWLMQLAFDGMGKIAKLNHHKLAKLSQGRF